MFNVTHEQFMDTPLEEIEWLLRIHKTHVDAENARNAKK